MASQACHIKSSTIEPQCTEVRALPRRRQNWMALRTGPWEQERLSPTYRLGGIFHQIAESGGLMAQNLGKSIPRRREESSTAT